MLIELKTKRLILRPLDIKDLETTHIYASDKENTRYMIHLPNETREKTLQFLDRVTNEWKRDKPRFFEFAIELNKLHIGAISIYLNSERFEGEIGWIINRGFWNNGYATEAALTIKEFAEETLNLTTLVAHCDSRNSASIKIMKKIGLLLVKEDGVRVYPKTGEVARDLKYTLSLRDNIETQ